MGRKVGPTSCHIVEGITAGRKKPSEKYSTKLDARFVAFAMRHNMRVINTFLEKAERHNVCIWNFLSLSPVAIIQTS